MDAQRILTAKADPALGRLQTFGLDSGDAPRDGEALLAVHRIALTTNNVTYALFGERMHYWDFFPSGEAGWGVLPVWGFADVVASAVDGLAAGERVYGFLPLATHLVVRPEAVSRGRFVDASPHRAALPATYNQYLRCAADAEHREADENALAIVQPLFATAFLLADFVHEHDAFGAVRALLSSASSKTAYASAWCLRERAPALRRIGLTSPRHADFVRGLGVYDEVLDYDAATSLGHREPALYADFAGNAGLRSRLHRHLGDALHHSAVIGATQFDEKASSTPTLPGAKPTFFFAPEQARRRAESWGAAELARRIGENLRRFLQRALDPSAPWLVIDEHRGLAAALELLPVLARGGGDPRRGHAIRIA